MTRQQILEKQAAISAQMDKFQKDAQAQVDQYLAWSNGEINKMLGKISLLDEMLDELEPTNGTSTSDTKNTNGQDESHTDDTEAASLDPNGVEDISTKGE